MKRKLDMSMETGGTVFRFTQMAARKGGILPNLPTKSATRQTINALNHRVVLKKKKTTLGYFTKFTHQICNQADHQCSEPQSSIKKKKDNLKGVFVWQTK